MVYLSDKDVEEEYIESIVSIYKDIKIERAKMRNDQIHFRTLLSIFIISVYTILLFLLQAITRSLQNKKGLQSLEVLFMPQTGIEPVLDLTRTGF